MKQADEYRIPARAIWRLRITTGLAAIAMLTVVTVPLGGPAALLFFLASRTSAPLSTLLTIAAVVFSLGYLFALIAWARTWGRLALGPWGGLGAIVGLALSVIIIPGLLWALSDLAYGWGVSPLGAVARVVAWLWFLAALYGAWRWFKTGYQEV